MLVKLMPNPFEKKFDFSSLASRFASRFAFTKVLLFLEFVGLCFFVDADVTATDGLILLTVLLANFSLIALSITVQLWADRFGLRRNLKLIAHIVTIGIVFLASLLFMRGHIESIANLEYEFSGGLYKEWILILVSVLSIFTVPFLRDKDTLNWWNFVFAFCKRGLVSLLYSIAVFVGLSLALGALDSLWDFQLLGYYQYQIIWFFAAFIVAPYHLLAELKIDTTTSQLQELPRFLFIFAKFILTPLTAIYILILYPYIFSFPFRSEWPANEATGYIFALLILGLAEIIILYGVGSDEKRQKFATVFTKVFSIFAMPAIFFWIYSLYLRIDAYAFTVNRIVLLGIILWFLGVFVYYLLAKVTNIKYVLSSFLALIIVLFYFPFSAFYWGEQAQLNRLYDIYLENDLVENGLMVRGDNATEDLNNMIGESFEYLNNYHALKKLEPKLSTELANRLRIDDNGYAGNLNYWYDNGNPFFEAVADDAQSDYISVYLAPDSVTVPAGYSKVKYVNEYSGRYDKVELSAEKINFTPDLTNTAFSNEACAGLSEPYADLCTTDISLMSVQLEQGLLIIVHFNGNQSEGQQVEVTSIEGYLFTN